MGIYKAQNGTWFVNKSWTNEQGIRKYKTKRGFKTKGAAKEYELLLLNQIASGIDIFNNPIFVDYFDQWVKTYKGTLQDPRGSIRPNTLREYLLDSKRIHQGFGQTKLKQINRLRYQNFINEFGSNHSKSTVTKLHNHIRACVNTAIEDGLITKNFTQGIVLNYNPDKKRKTTYLEDHQIKQLLHYLIQHRNPASSGSYMIITILYTGLRESEAAGLTWDCIDFDNLTLTINKSWDYKAKTYGPTKNLASNRIIGISQKLATLLQELQGNHPTKVFWSKSHQTLPQSHSLINTLRHVLKKLNIDAPGVHIHSLRHSQVALLLNANINLYDIAQRLGHSEINTTQKFMPMNLRNIRL
ncbi:tyrosine-type recombinase/integrase [Lactobacillus sp. PV034]|uniref:site-specific integrase n=1 Tax=Lactobacillus sp. PV034 TaxID=2594495 RepID=UPI00223FDE4A|nr:tyrosine-type recombinase/integrase [Lactobacillus sp. PV034]